MSVHDLPLFAVQSAKSRRAPARHRSRLVVEALVGDQTPPRRIRVAGQAAKSLAALVAARDRGVTAFEVEAWSLRLAAYTHDLKHRHGLVIETIREEHPGGWHGRHILRTPVEIISRSDQEHGHD